MSYDEHLISMAGGDGETVDQLAAIEARAQAAIVERESNFLDLRQFAPVIRAIDESSTDVPALLAMVREQQDQLDRILELAHWAGKRGWQIAPATLRNTINEARK